MSILEERVRVKQLEVKIICFKNSSCYSVKSYYSLTFNQVDLHFLATSLHSVSPHNLSTKDCRGHRRGQDHIFLFCTPMTLSVFLSLLSTAYSLILPLLLRPLLTPTWLQITAQVLISPWNLILYFICCIEAYLDLWDV